MGVLVSAFFLAGATFGGVLFSFYLQSKRRRREEYNAFGRLIDSVFIESAVNEAILGNIINITTAGKILTVDIEIGALKTSLTSDLIYKHAPWSLVKTMVIVSTELSRFNNILAMQRFGGSYGKSLTESDVSVFKKHAGTCRQLIVEALQPEIKWLRPQFEAELKHDKRSGEVSEKMKKILHPEENT